jgi:hypothetical protein
MTFRVIRKVVEHKILYKIGLKQYFIHLTVLEIERKEWGAFTRMCCYNARLHYILDTTICKANYLLKIS